MGAPRLGGLLLRQARPAQALEHMCEEFFGSAAVVRPRPDGGHSQARPPLAKLLDGRHRLSLSAKLAEPCGKMHIGPDQASNRMPHGFARKPDGLFVLPQLVQRARFEREI
jgi:hypothetical protein